MNKAMRGWYAGYGKAKQIKQLLETSGSVNVSELAEMFGVTGETIRRDLDRMDQQGMLLRTHGGATKLVHDNRETPYYTRKITNIDLKKELAKAALGKIRAGDQIVLDASSTAWFVAKALPNMDITVLTNSLLISSELSPKSEVKLICTGGALLRTSQAFVGSSAVNSLANYHVNKAFISSTGIHPARGLSKPHESAVLVKQKMISIADQVYALMDYTKFGVKDFVHVCSLDKIDKIITNEIYFGRCQEMMGEFADKVICR